MNNMNIDMKKVHEKVGTKEIIVYNLGKLGIAASTGAVVAGVITVVGGSIMVAASKTKIGKVVSAVATVVAAGSIGAVVGLKTGEKTMEILAPELSCKVQAIENEAMEYIINK